LARSQSVVRGNPRQKDHALGAAYFEQVKPDYLVIGHHAHVTDIYDMAYVTTRATLIAKFGEGDLGYEIYQFR
jgi:hypothetical protein